MIMSIDKADKAVKMLSLPTDIILTTAFVTEEISKKACTPS